MLGCDRFSEGKKTGSSNKFGVLRASRYMITSGNTSSQRTKISVVSKESIQAAKCFSGVEKNSPRPLSDNCPKPTSILSNRSFLKSNMPSSSVKEHIRVDRSIKLLFIDNTLSGLKHEGSSVNINSGNVEKNLFYYSHDSYGVLECAIYDAKNCNECDKSMTTLMDTMDCVVIFADFRSQRSRSKVKSLCQGLSFYNGSVPIVFVAMVHGESQKESQYSMAKFERLLSSYVLKHLRLSFTFFDEDHPQSSYSDFFEFAISNVSFEDAISVSGNECDLFSNCFPTPLESSIIKKNKLFGFFSGLTSLFSIHKSKK